MAQNKTMHMWCSPHRVIDSTCGMAEKCPQGVESSASHCSDPCGAHGGPWGPILSWDRARGCEGWCEGGVQTLRQAPYVVNFKPTTWSGDDISLLCVFRYSTSLILPFRSIHCTTSSKLKLQACPIHMILNRYPPSNFERLTAMGLP